MGGKKITTMEEALEAVRWDGSAFQDVPAELRSAELCMEAVKRWGRAL